jgi:hypothetical protein
LIIEEKMNLDLEELWPGLPENGGVTPTRTHAGFNWVSALFLSTSIKKMITLNDKREKVDCVGKGGTDWLRKLHAIDPSSRALECSIL